MMTLKHIDCDGREKVFPVSSVAFDPDTMVLVGYKAEGNMQWTHGRAFLMNDHGKTVATYVMKQKEQP